MAIQYVCKQCGTELENNTRDAGQKDTCPICRSEYIIPYPTHTWRTLILILLGSIIAGGVGIAAFLSIEARLSKNNSTTSADIAPVSIDNNHKSLSPKNKRTIHNQNDLLSKVTILDERHGPEVSGGYYVWCSIPIMTENEIRQLGNQLITKMRLHKGDHLKAWLYYNKEDYDSRSDYCCPCAIWLNAISYHDCKLRIVGPIPKRHNSESCFNAFTRGNYLFGSMDEDEAVIKCEYKPLESHMIFHDRWASSLSGSLHIQAIVLFLIETYLPGTSNPSPWAAIPNLQSITIHFYEKNSNNPSFSVRIDKDIYKKSIPLYREIIKVVDKYDNEQLDLLVRTRALVLKPQEYKTATDYLANQMYQHYEHIWIELFPSLKIEKNKLSRNAPSSFLRKYFFGGD